MGLSGRILQVVASGLLFVVAGCGGGSSPSAPPPPPLPASVSVSPSLATVNVGTTVQFTARRRQQHKAGGHRAADLAKERFL